MKTTITYKKMIIDLKEDAFKTLSAMAACQGTNLKELIESLLDKTEKSTMRMKPTAICPRIIQTDRSSWRRTSSRNLWTGWELLRNEELTGYTVNYESIYHLRIRNYHDFFSYHVQIVNNCVMFLYLKPRGQAYNKKIEKNLQRRRYL